MIAFPLLHLVYHRFIRREPQDEDERNDEDKVVQKEVPESREVCHLVAEKPDDHEVRPAHARELANADQNTESEGRRDRGLLQELRHRPVRDGRHFEFDGHVGEEPVQECDDAEDNQERGTKLPHEVRSVEEMQDFERAESYCEVRREDAGNVYTPNLQDLFTRELQSEQERYRDEEDGERARMH